MDAQSNADSAAGHVSCRPTSCECHACKHNELVKINDNIVRDEMKCSPDRPAPKC